MNNGKHPSGACDNSAFAAYLGYTRRGGKGGRAPNNDPLFANMYPSSPVNKATQTFEVRCRGYARTPGCYALLEVKFAHMYRIFWEDYGGGKNSMIWFSCPLCGAQTTILDEG